MAKPGTSQFTHQDDASAPIHTTDPNHLGAHVFGGPAPEDEDRETVVIGPPAYGSPDVRTLGHSVNPGQTGRSAPDLDSEFKAVQAQGEYMTEDDLNQMSKRDLIALAEAHGIEVNSSMKKDEVIDALMDDGVADEAEDEDSSDDDDSDSDSDDGTEGKDENDQRSGVS